jgi:hypothetical protein
MDGKQDHELRIDGDDGPYTKEVWWSPHLLARAGLVYTVGYHRDQDGQSQGRKGQPSHGDTSLERVVKVTMIEGGRLTRVSQ